jgi:hypothetical protein
MESPCVGGLHGWNSRTNQKPKSSRRLCLNWWKMKSLFQEYQGQFCRRPHIVLSLATRPHSIVKNYTQDPLHRLVPNPQVIQQGNALQTTVTEEGLTQESYIVSTLRRTTTTTKEGLTQESHDDKEEDNLFASSLLVEDSSSIAMAWARDILKPQINEVLQYLDTLKSQSRIEQAHKLLNDFANELCSELGGSTRPKRNIENCHTVNLNVEENLFVWTWLWIGSKDVKAILDHCFMAHVLPLLSDWNHRLPVVTPSTIFLRDAGFTWKFKEINHQTWEQKSETVAFSVDCWNANWVELQQHFACTFKEHAGVGKHLEGHLNWMLFRKT